MKHLATKMIKILGAVSGKVNKTGYNSHNKYAYVMEADLLDAVRDALVENKVFVFSSVEEVSYEGQMTTVRTKHTFVDAESGETHEVFSAGQGKDGQDKGVYKAITGASKYFLLKSFMMAGDEDPEKDTKKTAARPKPAPKSVPKSSPAGASKKKAETKTPKGFGASVTKTTKNEIELDDIPF